MADSHGPGADSQLKSVAARYGKTIRNGELRIPCPAHRGDDDNLAVSVKDGTLLAHCYSYECSFEDIIKALQEDGALPKQERPQRPTAKPKRSKAEYYHADGRTVTSFREDHSGECWRDDCKNKRPHKHCWQQPRGRLRGFKVKLWADKGSGIVVVTEGEKAAMAVAVAGVAAASYAGGAKNAGHADYSPLAGRDVVVWPDNDDPGLKAGAAVVAAVRKAGAKSVRIVTQPADAAKGADAADFDAGTVRQLVADATPIPEPEPAGDQADEPESAPAWPAPVAEPFANPWHVIGQWLADGPLRGRYRYAGHKSGWWGWNGTCWIQLDTTPLEMVDEISRDRYLYAHHLREREDLAVKLAASWKGNAAPTAEMMAALRFSLREREPQPAPHHFAAQNGVVDLRDGSVLPHSPDLGTRAVATGRYLPDEAKRLRRVFEARYLRTYNTESLDQVLDLVGLALSGMAGDYRSIVIIIGPSRSGKGDIISAILYALGERGRGVSPEWLSNRRGSDIDATGADLLEKQPDVVAIDEIGGDTQIGQSRLLSITGKAEWGARKPFKEGIKGTLRGQIWTTAVDLPKMDAGSGIAGRLAAIPTLATLPESDKLPGGAETQDMADAIVTLACLAARSVFKPGYTAPTGDGDTKREALAEMDPLREWLDHICPDDMSGETPTDFAATASRHLGRDIDPARIGRVVRASSLWEARRTHEGRSVCRTEVSRGSVTAKPTVTANSQR